MERTEKSFCRLCMAHCGMVVSIDENDHLLRVRGDHDDQQTLGYACFKGLQAAETHYSPHRILQPLKRQPDGQFTKIPLEQALDEIGAQLAGIVAQDGPEAVAGYRGSQGIITSTASLMLPAWLEALGSHKFFTSATIDQSAKLVAMGRIGMWPAGRVPFHQSDVFVVFGGNPLVSLASNGFDIRNPLKRLKEAQARGMKLIVIDPRYSETARHADVFLQPKPGEDVTIAAGMLRMILSEGWEDHDFCRQHVSQVSELRDAVMPFTPEYVERRAGVPAAKLREATEVFALHNKRGPVASGTGPNMGPHSNLAEHLFECLNVVCGRYLKVGEQIPNPGGLAHRWPRPAQVIPAPRWWDSGFKSRIGGYGIMMGEMMTGILADEILQPGPGQIRALLNDGGGIVNAVPDQPKITKALRSLDLLVSIEPFMTPTAQLSHYILPPKMQYERSDFPMFIYESIIYPEPFTRYTPPMVPPPPGAEVVDDAYVFWSLAKRLKLTINYDGVALDMTTAPSNDALLEIVAKRSPLSLAEISSHTMGVTFDAEPQFVLPGDPNSQDRFTVMPPDVAQEMREVAVEPYPVVPTLRTGEQSTHLLIVRRTRDMYNSTGRFVPTIRARLPYNLAHLHPEDLAGHGLAAGDTLEISSDYGSIRAIAADDPNLVRGVVSMSHGFGGLPDREANYLVDGASTNLLTSTDEKLETINAMPRMSSIPVCVRRSA